MHSRRFSFNVVAHGMFGGSMTVRSILQVSDGPLPGLAFGFPDNETEWPQEAQTITTISWSGVPHTSEYEVSCNPITDLEERGFQVHTQSLSHMNEALEV